MFTLITAIVIAMGVSFLCSVMEAALLSLNPGKLALLSKRRPSIGKICEALKNDIEKPIAVILILNTAAHTFGAAIAGAQFDSLFGSDYIWLFSFVFTVLMVQYTEILPKTLGCRFNAFIISHTARLLKFSITLLTPVIWLVHFINRPFEGKEAKEDTGTAMEEELDAIASMARKAQHITATQELAIQQIPDLKDEKIEKLMIPLQEIICLTDDMSREKVLEAARRFPHSRYPVIAALPPKQFIGVLEIRQLLFNNGDWRSLLHPIQEISAEEVQLHLMENCEKLDSRLLLVKDAANKVVGMITINDLFMKLFRKKRSISVNDNKNDDNLVIS